MQFMLFFLLLTSGFETIENEFAENFYFLSDILMHCIFAID